MVVKSDCIPAILIDSGCSDYRSAKIAANVLSNYFRVAKIWFGIDIEALFMLAVAFRFYFLNRSPNPVFQFIEKSCAEALRKEL